jgi:hypothetical protein
VERSSKRFKRPKIKRHDRYFDGISNVVHRRPRRAIRFQKETPSNTRKMTAQSLLIESVAVVAEMVAFPI